MRVVLLAGGDNLRHMPANYASPHEFVLILHSQNHLATGGLAGGVSPASDRG